MAYSPAQWVDILDGTPLLDLKPYTTKFNRMETACKVWQDKFDELTP